MVWVNNGELLVQQRWVGRRMVRAARQTSGGRRHVRTVPALAASVCTARKLILCLRANYYFNKKHIFVINYEMRN